VIALIENDIAVKPIK